MTMERKRTYCEACVASHALLLEAAHPAVEGVLGGARLADTLGYGGAEQGQGANFFVG